MVKVAAGRLAGIALILAASALAACGGDDDSPDPTATPSGSTPATSTATAPPGTPGADSTPDADPTPNNLAVLETGLLTPDELGENWLEQTTDVPVETAESMCGQDVRIIAPDVLRVLRNPVQGRIFTAHGLSVYESEADAIAQVDAVRQAMASACTELTTTSRNTTTEWTVTPAEMTPFGDESVATAATVQFPQVPDPSHGFFVLIRNGRYVAVVIDIPLTSLTLEQSQALAQAADDKLTQFVAANP